MVASTRIVNICSLQRPLFTRPIYTANLATFSTSCSSSSPKVPHSDEDADFLPWLQRKAGVEISSLLSIGKSAHGRSLVAAKPIHPGDCILKVPYNVQIAPDHLPPRVSALLPEELSNVAKLAVVIIVEQKKYQHSEWAPYISRLPQPGEMHNTVFWSDEELDMIRISSIYEETTNRKTCVGKEFSEIKSAFECFAEIFDGVTFKEFLHACTLVESRAWRSTRGVSLIPFADFLNHDGAAEEIVLSDENKKISEVIADRKYAPGDQVRIRYGKFSNATLLLDFGFTLPYNIYDEVQIKVDIPGHDPLYAHKMALLRRHQSPATDELNYSRSSLESFTISEVKSAKGKGKGIPQSLRAFARVLCSTSTPELSEFSKEAEQNDGRLARRPLKIRSREIEAHQFLLSRISLLIEEHNASIKCLELPVRSTLVGKQVLRKQMAHDLLTGELRVLKSASAWLKNYCTKLSES